MATSSYQSRSSICPKCGNSFASRGLGRHKQSCNGTLDLNTPPSESQHDLSTEADAPGTMLNPARDLAFTMVLNKRRLKAQNQKLERNQAIQQALGAPAEAGVTTPVAHLSDHLSALAANAFAATAFSFGQGERTVAPVSTTQAVTSESHDPNFDEPGAPDALAIVAVDEENQGREDQGTDDWEIGGHGGAGATDPSESADIPVVEGVDAPRRRPRDIKIVWHPSSKRVDQYIPFLDFSKAEARRRKRLAKEKLKLAILPSTTPWYPFSTLADFEAAELSLSTNMNKNQVNTLLDLLKRVQSSSDKTSEAAGSNTTRSALFRQACACKCVNHPLVEGIHPSVQPAAGSDLEDSESLKTAGQDSKSSKRPRRRRGVQDSYGQEWDQYRNHFTFRDEAHWNETWDAVLMSTSSLQMKPMTLKLKYREEDVEYDLWLIDLWDWCLDLLHDPKVIKHFEWDARKTYAYNGSVYERVFDEPWTADGWWDFQSKLPEGAKPFCILLYSDKTRLSSFGTAQGYPVLARCLNLPVNIRNSDGIGGGKLVGWLPIVKDESENSKKPDWIDFKRLVWHKALAEIMGRLEKAAMLSPAVDCADGERRQVTPHILIFSADYEEQSTVSLTRGSKALFPCPICMVSAKDITVATLLPEARMLYRSHESMKATFEQAQLAPTKAEGETILKNAGLRDIENAFWKMKNTDIYDALSWDRLHSYHLGIWSKHLLEELGAIMVSKTSTHNRRGLAMDLDEGLANVPRYQGLSHFVDFKSGNEYADGAKHEDFSKSIFYAMQNFVTERFYKELFAWLRLLRSYQELDMFAGLTVQTESTLQSAVGAFREFDRSLEAYVKARPDTKSWGFPKQHTHAHLLRDIVRKGVSRNYNTKPGEKANRPLKKIYQRQTNFKDTAPQIVRITERHAAVTVIRDRINSARDALLDNTLDDDSESSDSDSGGSDSDSSSLEPPQDPNTAGTGGPSGLSATRIVALEQEKPGGIRLLRKEDPIAISDLEAAANADGDNCFIRFRQKLSVAIHDIATERGVNIPSAMRALASIRETRGIPRRRGPQSLIMPDDKITRFNTARIPYESVVDWRVYHTLVRAHRSFFGSPRYDYVMLNMSVDENGVQEVTFAQVRLLFQFSLGGVVDNVKLALIHPFDAPLTDKIQYQNHDKAMRLIRLQAFPESESRIVLIDSIIRSVLLVPVIGAQQDQYILFDLLDQDLWMRCKTVKISTSEM